jgi:DNA-binding response OmpR family regulator
LPKEGLMSITIQKFRTNEAALPFFMQVDRLFDLWSTLSDMKQTRLAILAVGLREEDHGILRQVFSRSGWALASAATIGEAKRFLERNPVPVILCESNLPDGSWRDLSEAAATGERPPNVIVTSRLADDRLWAEVLNLGGYDVLAKPLDGCELFRALSSAWRNWHSVEVVQQEKAAAAG